MVRSKVTSSKAAGRSKKGAKMIERDFKKFLEKIANDELRNNRLARFLAIHWDPDERIPTDHGNIFNKIVPRFKDYLALKDEQNQIEESKTREKVHEGTILQEDDFRICSIRLSSVRGIDDKVNEIPFGIDLTNNSSTPCNAIIVGNNGSGKTSIFSALEYAYTDEISEANLRKYGTKKKPNYYEYLKNTNSTNDPFCEIKTIKNKTFDLKGERVINHENLIDRANPQASFISEYDVYDYGVSDFSGEDDYFHNKIAEILGFKEYIDFVEYLSILKSKKRKAEIDRLQSNQDGQENARKNKTKCEEKLKKLRNRLKGKTPATDSDQSRKDIEDIKERQSEEVEEILTEKLEKQYKEFGKSWREYNSMRSKDLEKEEIKFLELGLKLLEKEQNCPFCRQSKFNIITIKNNVTKKLEGVKKISELDQVLNKAYDDILNNLKSLVSGLEKFQALIEDDLQVLLTISEMADITIEEKGLKDNSNFAELLDLRNEIKQLKQEFTFDNQERKNLYQFLNKRAGLLFNNPLIKELNAFKKKREKRLAEVISQLQKKDGGLTSAGNEDDIKFEIKTNEEKIEGYEKEIKKLKLQEPDLKKARDALEIIKSEVKPLLNRVEEEIKVILKEAIKPMENVLVKTLEMFLEEDLDIEIKFKETSSDSEISRKRLVIELVKNKSGVRTTPKKYFNTFRYKIFCGTISIGVALASRKNSGINLPLILDDEFFASDIVNRSEFESYFRHIILMYRKISPDLPFQFILFTHDELIFQSAKEAVENVWEEIRELNNKEGSAAKLDDYWQYPLDQKTKFARLLSSSEKDDSPREMEGEKYWNLLFEFNLQEN